MYWPIFKSHDVDGHYHHQNLVYIMLESATHQFFFSFLSIVDQILKWIALLQIYSFFAFCRIFKSILNTSLYVLVSLHIKLQPGSHQLSLGPLLKIQLTHILWKWDPTHVIIFKHYTCVTWADPIKFGYGY